MKGKWFVLLMDIVTITAIAVVLLAILYPTITSAGYCAQW